MKTLLAKYIEELGLSISTAAKQIGLTRVWLSKMVNGNAGGPMAANAIEKWSKGRVPAETILKPELSSNPYYLQIFSAQQAASKKK